MMANPGEVAEIIAAGHEVGNHSYTHERMILGPAEEMVAEIRATDAGLRGAGAEEPFTFRPPFGSKGIAVPSYLAEAGRVTVMWEVALEPEAGEAPEDYAARIVAAARPGSIILMHPM
ncbi:MAG: polysaccharide deacetylase family protein [Shimia sp.]